MLKKYILKLVMPELDRRIESLRVSINGQTRFTNNNYMTAMDALYKTNRILEMLEKSHPVAVKNAREYCKANFVPEMPQYQEDGKLDFAKVLAGKVDS